MLFEGGNYFLIFNLNAYISFLDNEMDVCQQIFVRSISCQKSFAFPVTGSRNTCTEYPL
jgi:hypothetical protein